MTKQLPFILTGIFVLLLGLAQLLVLPPFEGADEHGHFSMIRQYAAQGFVFDPAKLYIDKTFYEYGDNAPTFYSVLEPYDQNEGYTYRSFFEMPELVKPYRETYADKPFTKKFEASEKQNWQQQHPPLYYMLLSYVQRAVEGLSFLDQFFALRFASYLLAWGGFMIGLWGSLRYSDPAMRKPLLFAYVLYPIFFLQFTPEFARLGNDSLCLFLIGIGWTLFLRSFRNEHDRTNNLLFGLVMGLGLVTKAFFIPIVAGFGVYKLIVMLRDWKDRQLFSRRFDDLVLIGLPLVVFGFWHIYKWRSTGVFLGHFEYKTVYEHGENLWDVFVRRNTEYTVLYGFFGVFMSWTWSGTLSQPRYIDFFQYPYLFFTFWLVARGYLAMFSKKVSHPMWFVHWVLAFFLAGIFHHTFIILCLDNQGGTPGWYIHILAPMVAYLIAFGLAEAWQCLTARILVWMMVPYTLYFFGAVLWQELALYSGCAHQEKLKYLSYYDNAYCLTKGPMVFENLAVIASPVAGVAAFALAMFALAATLLVLRRRTA